VRQRYIFRRAAAQRFGGREDASQPSKNFSEQDSRIQHWMELRTLSSRACSPPAPLGASLNDRASENFLCSDASCLRNVMRASQHNFAGVLH
jgi:hypothetical protein